MPSARPVGAVGGPVRLPATNVPDGDETAATSATCDSCAAKVPTTRLESADISGITTVILLSGLTANLSRSRSPTWRELAMAGSTRSSGNPHLMPRKGAPNNNSTAISVTLTAMAWRMTK